MLPRDRVIAALDWRTPDVVPVEYHPSPAGLHEHGEKLRELFARYPHDFGDFSHLPIPAPDPKWIDSSGRYCELRRDEWGVLSEHLIYGVAGHPVERPLDDWTNLGSFRAPQAPPMSGPHFERARAAAAAHRRTFFLKSGWPCLFEAMHAVRRFEDVLMDVERDTPQINRLADIITDYRVKQLEYHLACGTDAVQFADDFGTQAGLMISRRTWRRFFRPRYERMIAPVRAAGVKVLYHTCGDAWDLLDDIAELGVDAIWPQLNLYDLPALAGRCRALRMAAAIHPERSHLMTSGTPAQVRDAVLRLADVFEVGRGGAWFYVEVDNGFPFGNVRALIETIAELRGQT
jgi:hypothetical protein